jgi:hypothetical protein
MGSGESAVDLHELNQVAAGVVQYGNGSAPGLDRIVPELDAKLFQATVLGTTVVDRE